MWVELVIRAHAHQHLYEAMVTIHTDKTISDIPLKPSQETFVDDPALIDEVDLEELDFDLSHGIKNINRLHVYHGMAILENTIQLLLELQQDRQNYSNFRSQHLANYGIEDPSPCSSDPLKQENDSEDDDSTFAEPMSSLESGLESDIGFISTESLIKTTSLQRVTNPITSHSTERLQKELNSHITAKTKSQAEHLLRSFSLVKPPPITIKDFLSRIHKYSPSISVSVYTHAAYLFFKLALLFDVVQFTPLNVHRLLLASLRCSTKICEDIHQKQKSFAVVGGVALKDLSTIEVSFLFLCNFNLVISEHILNKFLSHDYVSLRRFMSANVRK